MSNCLASAKLPVFALALCFGPPCGSPPGVATGGFPPLEVSPLVDPPFPEAPLVPEGLFPPDC